MSRVLLVGAGPLPGPGLRQVGFPQLRTAHFAAALAEAGHAVDLVCLGSGRWELAQGPFRSTLGLDPDRPGWLDQLREHARARDPELVVSAGPFLPLHALQLVEDRPWWADLPGDPFAEAQAKAALAGRDEPLPEGPWQAHAALALGALARADAFSVCSTPQRYALLGQLGALGRLSRARPERRWAWVVPPAWRFDMPAGEPRCRAPGSPLTVALVGGFNTWLDQEALLQGLLSAMDRGLPLRVVATGGAIAGHHSAGWEDFVAGVQASPHRERFELLGWVPHEQLSRSLAEAQLLLQVDRAGAEPTLGSRTRLLFGLHQGLELLATTPCELAADFSGRGYLEPLASAEPEQIADALEAAVDRGSDGDRVRRAQAWAAQAYDPRRIAAPLLDWAAAPDRAPAGTDGTQELATQLARTRQELARVYATPTWRALSTLHGWLRRLLGVR
jgi:hypothetical protein